MKQVGGYPLVPWTAWKNLKPALVNGQKLTEQLWPGKGFRAETRPGSRAFCACSHACKPAASTVTKDRGNPWPLKTLLRVAVGAHYGRLQLSEAQAEGETVLESLLKTADCEFSALSQRCGCSHFCSDQKAQKGPRGKKAKTKSCFHWAHPPDRVLGNSPQAGLPKKQCSRPLPQNKGG